VEDQQIAWIEVLRQVANGGMGNGVGARIQYQHPGRVSLGRWMLGDQLLRQRVVEISGSQKSRGCSPLLALTRPRCSYASLVATRPRGVRARKPSCIKKGS